jgi:hypothetical protein
LIFQGSDSIICKKKKRKIAKYQANEEKKESDIGMILTLIVDTVPQIIFRIHLVAYADELDN